MYMRGRGMLGCYVCLVLFCLIDLSFGNYVINVEHKYGGRNSEKRTLSALTAHDQHRHGRSLSAVDVPLGGSTTTGGIYYAKIGLGTPSKDYYMSIDSGSHITWVNCAGCKNCANKSALDIPLPMYDQKESKTSKRVPCGEKLCDKFKDNNSEKTTCKNGEMCPMNLKYGTGNSIGYFVTDTVRLSKVSGDLKTTPMDDDAFTFGCATEVDAESTGKMETATGGLIGLGNSEVSLIAQLAAAGKVKKTFSHCLDPMGGGTFAIGEVEEPKVKSVPYIDNGSVLFAAKMIGVEVNKKPLNLSSKALDPKNGTTALIDSGSNYGFVDHEIYTSLVKQILDAKPGLTAEQNGSYQCFRFNGLDVGVFPNITFHFDNSLSLNVYPNEYLAANEGQLCITWMSVKLMGMDGLGSPNLFGVMSLINKLVTYDMEKKTVGWTDYNCSLGVKVKDGQSKDQYNVGSHNLKNGLASSPAMSPSSSPSSTPSSSSSSPPSSSPAFRTPPLHWAFILLLPLVTGLAYI